MTISSTNRKAGPYAGNGSSTVFPFSFKVFSASDLYVTRTSSEGAVVVLDLGTDFTVSLNANQDDNPGGTVTLSAALESGYSLTVTSDIQPLQPVEFTNLGGFYPRIINDALDRLTILVQQLITSGISSGNIGAEISGQIEALSLDIAAINTELNSVGHFNDENVWNRWQYLINNNLTPTGNPSLMYGWVAALTRTSDAKQVVPGYFVGEASGGTGTIWGIATEAWTGTRSAVATSSCVLVGAEFSCVSQYSNQSDAVIGVDVVFKNRPDALLTGAVRGGLGSNRYNLNSYAYWITSQPRSTAGEYCGWTRGIMFDTNSLDRDINGKAVAIDMANVNTARADLLKFPDGTYLNSGGSLAWTSVPTFGAGFSLFGVGTPVAYRKDPHNIIRLRGALGTSGATNAGTAFTLPVGFRPAQTALFPGYGASFVQIEPDGTVHPSWGTDPGLITLDGIAFSTV